MRIPPLPRTDRRIWIGLLTVGALMTGSAMAVQARAVGDVNGAVGTPVPVVASAAQDAAPLIVFGDTVRGALGLMPEELPLLACVQTNRFPQGSQIVWRMRVIDPATGTAMDDTSLTGVTLTLPDGSTRPFRFGPHPRMREDDFFWTATFTIPEDYPTGAFTWQVEASDNQGRTGSIVQFNVASSMLQVVPKGAR